MNKVETIKRSYELAKTQYDSIGVNSDAVLRQMNDVIISLHCWQTDDVGGFEKPDAELAGGGIQVTGSFPGKATSIREMRKTEMTTTGIWRKILPIIPGTK